MNQVLVTNDEYTFRQACHFGSGALQAFDDQRAGSSAQQLLLTETMNMRVIPVKAGRLVVRDAEAIFERSVARLHGGPQDVIFTAGWRNCQSVEMKIGGHQAHGCRGGTEFSGIVRTSRMDVRRCSSGRLQILQIVLKMEDNLIAGWTRSVGDSCPAWSV